MAARYTRPLSPLERVWLTADAMAPPFVGHIIFEGEGEAELDRDTWQAAMETAAEANPGCRLVLRGRLWRCRWVDGGAAPPVRVVESGWSGMDAAGSAFLDDPLPPSAGPTCELVIVPGETARVVFRAHHAVMDGRGILTWAEDFFRVLRGEEPLGSRSSVTDIELARSFQSERMKLVPEDALPPTGAAEGATRGGSWSRVRVPAPVSLLVPRVAALLARETRRRGEGTVRVQIPVDMRPRREGLRSTGNLTGMLYLEVAPESTPEELGAELRRQLDGRREGVQMGPMEALRFVPLRVMRRRGLEGTARMQKNGRYGISATLSNLGRLPLERYRGGGFRATAGFTIPPTTGNHPLFVGLSGSADWIDLVGSAPSVLATGGRLDELMHRIAAGLAGGPA